MFIISFIDKDLVLIVSVHRHCILLQCSKRSESKSIYMTKKQQCKLYLHEAFVIIVEYVVVIILGLNIASTLFHITYSPLSEPHKNISL